MQLRFLFSEAENLYFRLTAVKEGNYWYGTFYFLVDNVRVACVDVSYNNNVPQGTGTINLFLSAGQIVQIENAESSVVYGTDAVYGYFSYFTGFLLFVV